MFIHIIICCLSLLVHQEAFAAQEGPIEFGSATISIEPGGNLTIQAQQGFHNLMLTYILYNMFRNSLVLCIQECRKNHIDPRIYFDFTMDEAFKESIQDFVDESFAFESADEDYDPCFCANAEELCLDHTITP